MLRSFLVTLLFGLSVTGSSLADLAFDPPWIDLGEVRAGQVFHRQIKVTNNGQSAVHVREFKSSCGCMKPRLQPERLEPGQTGLLTLQVNTLSAPPGVQGWRVRLYLTDGTETEFILRANVLQELVVTPASLTLYGDKPGSHTITFTDRRARPLKLVTATTTSSLLSASITSATTAQLNVKEGFPEGRHDEEVILTTDDPAYPLLHFPVKIIKRSRARFAAMPSTVELYGGSGEPLLERVVTIRDQKGQPMTIERLETSHPDLKAEVKATQETSAMLHVSLGLQALVRGPFTGHVTVIFRGTAERLTIPVRCP